MEIQASVSKREAGRQGGRDEIDGDRVRETEGDRVSEEGRDRGME